MADSTFGERFSFARSHQAHRGFGEDDRSFAEAIGVAPSSITAYKTQRDPPPTERVLAIALRCGVDPGWLAFEGSSLAPAPEGFATWLDNRRTRGTALEHIPRAAPRRMTVEEFQVKRSAGKRPGRKRRA